MVEIQPMTCNCIQCRRDRARELIDALNEQAPGRVVHGALQAILYAKANEPEPELPFCGRVSEETTGS